MQIKENIANIEWTLLIILNYRQLKNKLHTLMRASIEQYLGRGYQAFLSPAASR